MTLNYALVPFVDNTVFLGSFSARMLSTGTSVVTADFHGGNSQLLPVNQGRPFPPSCSTLPSRSCWTSSGPLSRAEEFFFLFCQMEREFSGFPVYSQTFPSQLLRLSYIAPPGAQLFKTNLSIDFN